MATKKQPVKKSAPAEAPTKRVDPDPPAQKVHAPGAVVVRASAGGDFTPVSSDLHNAVCAEIIEVNQVQTPFGVQDQLKFVFQVEEMDNAKPPRRKEVRATHNKVLGSATKPSNLRKMLESWRGKQFTPDEIADGIDIMKVVGQPLRIQTMQTVSTNNPDRKYAKIMAYLPADRQHRLAPDPNYIPEAKRVKKDKTQQPQHVSDDGYGQQDFQDDDIPF